MNGSNCGVMCSLFGNTWHVNYLRSLLGVMRGMKWRKQFRSTSPLNEPEGELKRYESCVAFQEAPVASFMSRSLRDCSNKRVLFSFKSEIRTAPAFELILGNRTLSLFWCFYSPLLTENSYFYSQMCEGSEASKGR